MKKRKVYITILSVLMSALMLASLLLAGCGNKADDKPKGILHKHDNEEIEEDKTDSDVTDTDNLTAQVEETPDETLTFEDLICGTYLCDPDDEQERRVFDILSIDGRLYIEYSGMYEYSAAEMELLEEEPLEKDGNYYYMVRMYPFSTFAFAGEFQGGYGEVCCIKKTPEGTLELSKGAAIHDVGGFTLIPAENGEYVHPILAQAKQNTQYPDIIGSWRCNNVIDGITYEFYYEFHEDGVVNFVNKAEGYVPSVFRGIYDFANEDGVIKLLLDSETVGNGEQPAGTLTLEYDESTGSPKFAKPDSNLDTKLNKTAPCSHSTAIPAGPCGRADEIEEMWAEYKGELYFEYDFNPDMIASIEERAKECAETSSEEVISIQETNNGGLMWMRCYDTDATKDYIYYEFGTGDFKDVFGNKW